MMAIGNGGSVRRHGEEVPMSRHALQRTLWVLPLLTCGHSPDTVPHALASEF